MKDDLDKYIRLCIKNDREGQLKIYQLFSPVLYGICLKYMRNEDDAKDVFQEAFVIVFQKIGQYKFEGSFEGWLKRIFINKLIETLNKKKKESFFLDVFDPDTDFVEEEELDIAPVEQEKLLEYIRDLPDQYRTVFNLYVFEKLKHKEIAELLKISEGTSKSNLNRAKSILQKKIMSIKNFKIA
ncbi:MULTISPECIES: RNA polymerase sigma factor [Flavobacterium]|uniref:RNA polymerase subunit sigma-24 n=1 Tax=Flavobacterium tructae TaxID=1114873 RepID=A0ABX4D7J1_9FLAO|nr:MULTISPECIES: sigma-70 family RNA polymerase sigma factor [Flavobacterium]MDL2143654.1 sigma-70 family RNA polymerase sigma factor [Flavobacterium tructae]OXB19514.1 RNA polymerase subunit sigma-24 [Flavobacterium tructae]OXB25196.1 RNA polymerase subunit sigma-24 [Flavobacterium tructae]